MTIENTAAAPPTSVMKSLRLIYASESRKLERTGSGGHNERTKSARQPPASARLGVAGSTAVTTTRTILSFGASRGSVGLIIPVRRPGIAAAASRRPLCARSRTRRESCGRQRHRFQSVEHDRLNAALDLRLVQTIAGKVETGGPCRIL